MENVSEYKTSLKGLHCCHVCLSVGLSKMSMVLASRAVLLTGPRETHDHIFLCHDYKSWDFLPMSVIAGVLKQLHTQFIEQTQDLTPYKNLNF
jgi:hypothetical protein